MKIEIILIEGRRRKEEGKNEAADRKIIIYVGRIQSNQSRPR